MTLDRTCLNCTHELRSFHDQPCKDCHPDADGPWYQTRWEHRDSLSAITQRLRKQCIALLETIESTLPFVARWRYDFAYQRQSETQAMLDEMFTAVSFWQDVTYILVGRDDKTMDLLQAICNEQGDNEIKEAINE